MSKPRKIVDFIIEEMHKEELTRIYIGEFGLLADAYSNYLQEVKPTRKVEHPARVLETCMAAVRRSDKFNRVGEIKSIHFSHRETWHPIYELEEKRK